MHTLVKYAAEQLLQPELCYYLLQIFRKFRQLRGCQAHLCRAAGALLHDVRNLLNVTPESRWFTELHQFSNQCSRCGDNYFTDIC